MLCPHDYSAWWDHPLSDDVLRAAFARKPSGVFLTVILDLCHSGSGTREVNPPGEFAANRGRYVAPPELNRYHGDTPVPINRLGVKQERGYGQTSDSMNHILLAACRNDQTAADASFGGRPNGAWTYAILRALKTLKNPSAQDIYRCASLFLRNDRFEQVPVIEGPKALKERLFMGGLPCASH